MLVIGVSTVIFILTFVMPKMAVIFMDAGQVLPLADQGRDEHQPFFQSLWDVWPLVAGGLCFIGVQPLAVDAQGSILIGQFLLNLPLVRGFVLKVDLARFTRTMSLLLESGLTIIRSIEMAVPTMHNPQLKMDLLLCVQSLAAGENLGQCLAKSSLIPPMMVQLITVGEESGIPAGFFEGYRRKL